MCFMVLSGQTQRLLRPPHTCNNQPDARTRGRVRVGEDRPDSTRLAASSVCVCALLGVRVCPLQCMLSILGNLSCL